MSTGHSKMSNKSSVMAKKLQTKIVAVLVVAVSVKKKQYWIKKWLNSHECSDA
jgi:UDP-N-acetyl-D-mannosaminuronic acid transferase (WecB/TagA/CpsF family)